MIRMLLVSVWLFAIGVGSAVAEVLQEYAVPAGSQPHDVAPAADGGVWYTAQRAGALGWLDPKTGKTRQIALGSGSSPHGVIVGPDGAAWVTDSGLNAIVRVESQTDRVRIFHAPADAPDMNLNTATFDKKGMLWFTGQAGYYGRLDPASGKMEIFDAPRGRGPYGICTAPDGSVYYASLTGSHIARIDVSSGRAIIIEPPTRGQGARRVWADSKGGIWVSEWNVGKLARYQPASNSWREWKLPGNNPRAYAVYVDEKDQVWLSDFDANVIVRFDPASEAFEVFKLPTADANVRQILGRAGEVWLPESGADKIAVIRPDKKSRDRAMGNAGGR